MCDSGPIRTAGCVLPWGVGSQFWPPICVADVAVPLIDLSQADSCQSVNGWAQQLMWVTSTAGFHLSGAFVVAVTGLFPPDE